MTATPPRTKPPKRTANGPETSASAGTPAENRAWSARTTSSCVDNFRELAREMGFRKYD